jgi:hypothetical protein
MNALSRPLWSQEQAIAYEVALEAINDVIAGYSEQIALEQDRPSPNIARIAWLEMRTDQAVSVHHSLNVCDDSNVQQTISEFSAIVHARNKSRLSKQGF